MEGSTSSSLPEESDGLTEVQASQRQRTLERWEDKRRDPFFPTKFSNLGAEILVEWIAPYIPGFAV